MIIHFTKKIRHIMQKLTKFWTFFAMKKKIAFFSLIAVPITSVGAGMTLTVDNAGLLQPKPLIASDTVVNLDENIIVNFTETIKDIDKYEKNIAIHPQTDVQYFWGNDDTRLTIVPQSMWKPETEYSLALPHDIYTDGEGISTIFSFETVSYPEIISTNITAENQYVGEGESIIVRFDRAIEHFDVHAVVRPMIATEQKYDAEKRELHITITEQSKSIDGFHTVTVFAKHRRQKSSGYYPLSAISFTALMSRPDLWPSSHQERLDVARRSTAPQILDGKYIDVNLDAQITTLFEDGRFVANFVSSTGAKDTPTPTGIFEIYNKNPYALSSMFQVYLPYWMAFTSDGLYGFHDLIVWPEGHEDMPSGGKESEASIGNAVSPGCVRHDAKDSKFLYNWTNVGTPVVIY